MTTIVQHVPSTSYTITDMLSVPAWLTRYNPLGPSELQQEQHKLTFLVDGILVEGQPQMVLGPPKCLKTTLTLDLALSVASGSPFLNTFEVLKTGRVLVFSGESGLPTIKEICNRICERKGIDFKSLPFLISTKLPDMNNQKDIEMLEQLLTAEEIDLVVVDPVYLAMDPDGNESSLFRMGRMLRRINDACSAAGATLLLVHHTTSSQKTNIRLEHASWAGFKEFARGWITLERQGNYIEGSGAHKLKMKVGGRAGHGGQWSVVLNEGNIKHEQGRTYVPQVNALGSSDIECLPDTAQCEDSATQDKIRMFLKGGPSTVSAVATGIGSNYELVKIAIARLVAKGKVKETTITRSNGRTYPGVDLADPSSPDIYPPEENSSSEDYPSSWDD